MKKVAFLALLPVLAVAGCGGDDDDSASRPAAPKPTAVANIDTGAPIVTTGTGDGEGRPGLPDLSKLDDLPSPSGVSGAGACASSGLSPSAANLGRVRSVILCLHNNERKARGLRPLRINARLNRAALGHSRAMVARKFFAHDAPGGGNVVTRARRAGYIPRSGRWTVGENLAFGSGPLGAPGKIMEAWMNSPGHRANVLTRSFKEVGIGVVLGAPRNGLGGGVTYTAVFGAIKR